MTVYNDDQHSYKDNTHQHFLSALLPNHSAHVTKVSSTDLKASSRQNEAHDSHFQWCWMISKSKRGPTLRTWNKASVQSSANLGRKIRRVMS